MKGDLSQQEKEFRKSLEPLLKLAKINTAPGLVMASQGFLRHPLNPPLLPRPRPRQERGGENSSSNPILNDCFESVCIKGMMF